MSHLVSHPLFIFHLYVKQHHKNCNKTSSVLYSRRKSSVYDLKNSALLTCVCVQKLDIQAKFIIVCSMF